MWGMHLKTLMYMHTDGDRMTFSDSKYWKIIIHFVITWTHFSVRRRASTSQKDAQHTGRSKFNWREIHKYYAQEQTIYLFYPIKYSRILL